MKILQVHNEYQHFGGEEVVVAAENSLLCEYGHETRQWIVKNSELQNTSTLTKAKVALQSIWSHNAYRRINRQLLDFQPDVVHVHNTIPLISPSIYAACKSEGIPVVHTLHNYKLICPGAYLYRGRKTCEDCIGKFVPYLGILHGCYRSSRAQTAISVAGLATHRLRGTYRNDVDIYIALSRFARQKFIEGGLPAEKIAVKPNFVSSEIKPGKHTGGYALFVGKLVQYKGIETLLQAWHLLDETIPLKIVGQGPLEILLKSNLPPGVEYLGQLPREKVLSLMQEANLVVFPSEWYEPFGIVMIEAFATGLPVIATRLGSAAEIVRDGTSGWHFNPEDPQDLARIIRLAWSNPEEMKHRGEMARKQYEDYYSAEKNYQMLLSIYQTAINWSKKDRNSTVF